MTVILKSLAATVLLISGVLLLIQIYNRLILQMKQGALRAAISLLTVFVLTSLPLLIGYRFGSLNTIPWTFLLLSAAILPELAFRLRQRSIRSDTCNETVIVRDSDHRGGWLSDTSDALVVRRFRLTIASYGGPTMRIIHLSDFHIDGHNEVLESVVSTANTYRPDFVFLTGDYTDSPDDLADLIPYLTRLHSRFGTYAVLGNHDYWSQPERIRHSLRECGITFPGSHGLEVKTEGDSPVYIHGIEYPHVKPWPLGCIDSTESALHIALSHTPDNFFKLAESRVDLVFSGHLHGGQWRLPFIGPVVAPSRYDRLLDHGHFVINRTHQFVTAGLGNVWIRRRINCPPEILAVEIEGSSCPSVPGQETAPVFPCQRARRAD